MKRISLYFLFMGMIVSIQQLCAMHGGADNSGGGIKVTPRSPSKGNDEKRVYPSVWFEGAKRAARDVCEKAFIAMQSERAFVRSLGADIDEFPIGRMNELKKLFGETFVCEVYEEFVAKPSCDHVEGTAHGVDVARINAAIAMMLFEQGQPGNDTPGTQHLGNMRSRSPHAFFKALKRRDRANEIIGGTMRGLGLFAALGALSGVGSSDELLEKLKRDLDSDDEGSGGSGNDECKVQ